MTSFPINRPKFFKVILRPEANYLEIPTEYAIKHGRELSNHVYLNVPNGESWEIELIKSDDEILLDKGWEKFRDYYSVQFCYFLVFVYDGDSRFTVFMFNRTCTEISFPVNRPKFFKVILEPEANNLVIPTEFTIKHGCELTGRVFFNVPNGKLWEIELVKSDDDILLERGWEKFRDHYCVEFGYFLVFVYDGDSRFTVFVFNRTCIEIEYPFDDIIEENGSDSSAATLDENWQSKNSIQSERHEFGPCQEESDGSLETREVAEKSADKMKLDGEGTENNEGEENLADQEGCSSCTGTKLKFEKELTLYTAHRLIIEKDFVDRTGIRSQGRMRLENTEGKEWYVNIVGNKNSRRNGLALCGGWMKFLIDNKIIVGSTMSFEFISSSKLKARVVKTGPNEKELFSNVVRRSGKYIIGASHGRVRRKRTNISRTINSENDDEQIKETENGLLVGSKSDVSLKMETMRENCTEIEDQFHYSDEEVGSESDTSNYILEDKCKTKKRKRLAVVPPREANDASVKKKIKTEESDENMKAGGEVTENYKDRNLSIDSEDGLTITKQLTPCSAYKFEVTKKFEKCTGLKVHEQITVQNMEGVEWPVGIVGSTGRNFLLGLCSGWKQFLADNKVTVGSTISLKFISTSKFQAQVVKPGPNKRKLLGNLRRRGGKYLIIGSSNVVKRKAKHAPRAIKSENHDDYQTKEGKENAASSDVMKRKSKFAPGVIKTKNHDGYQNEQKEENADYQTEEGEENGSESGSKLNAPHIMKTRRQVKLIKQQLRLAICSLFQGSFVVSKISNPEGLEWFSIITTPNPIFTHLAGRTWVWKALSTEVLQASFNVPADVEHKFRSKRNAEEIFFPPPN